MIKRNGLLALLPDTPRTTQTIALYELANALASQLRGLRQRAGLTQKQVGDAVGVSQGRISQIESGLIDEAPNLDMIARYAAACGYQLNPVFVPLNEARLLERTAAAPEISGEKVWDFHPPADPLEFLTGPVIEIGAQAATDSHLTVEENASAADDWIVIPQEKA